MTALLLSFALSGPLGAQEEAGAPADTAPADTAAAAPASRDTTEGPPPSFPRGISVTDSASGAVAQTWEREELLDSSAFTLLDFLQEEAPGVLPLRAGFHLGPHHLVDGLLGPGALRVVVDGREIPPLEPGQPDLQRISLASVDRVRLLRRAGEMVVEVSTARHASDQAYSRVTGGTGQPGMDLIRGVFTNGAGDHFTVAAALDHLNVGAGPTPGNRLDAWAKVSWMPLGNESGLEVVWHSDAVERTVGEQQEVDRGDLLFHARADLTPGLQLDAWAGRTTREPGPLPPEPPDGEDDEAQVTPSLEVDQVQLRLDLVRPGASLRLDAQVRDAEGMAKALGEMSAGFRLFPGVEMDLGARGSLWDDFEAHRLTAGVGLRPPLPGAPSLRVEGATGIRGVPRPGGEPVQIDYEAFSASAGIGVGPYRFTERVTRTTVGRQFPFGGIFDSGLAPLGGARAWGFETRGRGPLIPVEPLARRFRVRGFWRHHTVDGEPLPLYLPRELARGELLYRDWFFDRNLEVQAKVRLLHRSAMRSGGPGQADPVLLPAETTADWSLVLRIDTFRLWWRVGNMRRVQQQDFASLPFPANRNVFGLRWEFLN